ncbi:unnamed protein product [Clonostachys rosea]|uniref:Gram-positive cocci surface proteins LPxTG domain-containing protein n=1 Tax=Bionectria ochroleuca TaxID=29856 RepID=A0ABY6U2B8_BIOOC|nr:unnamed protein product [Clonostachys rosea]
MSLTIREKPQVGDAKRWIIIGSIGGAFLIILMVALVVLHIRRRKRDRQEGLDIDGDDEVTGHDLDNLGVTGQQGRSGGADQNQNAYSHRDGSPSGSYMGGHQRGQFGAYKTDSISSEDTGHPRHPPGAHKAQFN